MAQIVAGDKERFCEKHETLLKRDADELLTRSAPTYSPKCAIMTSPVQMTLLAPTECFTCLPPSNDTPLPSRNLTSLHLKLACTELKRTVKLPRRKRLLSLSDMQKLYILLKLVEKPLS